MSPSAHLPSLLIVAGASGQPLMQLFGRRGFVTGVVGGHAELNTYLSQGGSVPNVAIIDFEVPNGEGAARLLVRLSPRPLLVGVAAADGILPAEEILDAAFARPVDPARLFARVVSLLAERKTGKARRRRLTGVVAAVRGNTLFHQVERVLATAVPPVNAGAVLEKALKDLGSTAGACALGDVAAILASGRLEHAMQPFGEPTAIRSALVQVQSMLG